MPELIGLFGGTFDPPHIGHLTLSKEMRAQLNLDRLFWILTPNPPHKQGQPVSALEDRLAMVELVLIGVPGCELSRVELDRPGPHYALDTVRIIHEQNPAAQLVYLMGGDSLHDLPTWERPTELVAALHLIGVMRRPGDSIDLPGLEKLLPGLTAKMRFVDAPQLDIASHEIRQRVADGRSFRQYLPPAVYDYILEHDLYR
jgi:nicotinate-nucleotide adenylyltransferase